MRHLKQEFLNIFTNVFGVNPSASITKTQYESLAAVTGDPDYDQGEFIATLEKVSELYAGMTASSLGGKYKVFFQLRTPKPFVVFMSLSAGNCVSMIELAVPLAALFYVFLSVFSAPRLLCGWVFEWHHHTSCSVVLI